MINLDQHSKDQSSLLSPDWHKNHPVIPPHDDDSVLALNAAKFSPDDQFPTKQSRSIDPVTPADAVDPVPAPSSQNPSPETPGDLLSAPNDDNDSNSSLSPVPSNDPQHDPPPEQAHQDPVDDVGVLDPTDPPHADHVPTAASRQSTPLTELSGPPTPSRARGDAAAESGDPGLDAQAEANKDAQEADDAEGKSDAAEDATVVAIDTIDETGKGRSVGGEMVGELHEPQGPEPLGDVAQSLASTTTQPKPPSLASTSRPNGVFADTPRPSTDTPSLAEQISTPGPQKSPSTDHPPDEKASTILQLNAELLKVCIECQSRHIMQSSEFNSYATRLQSNLTWLAAAADRSRQAQIPLPMMSPPTTVSWTSPETIIEYYQRLPGLFAKEIAMRQREAAQASTAGVKRGPDPADDATGMRKRVDAGERRLSNPVSVTASSPPHARSPSVMSNGTVGSASGMGMGMGIPLSGADPHVPPAQSMIGMGMNMGMGVGMGMGMGMTPQPQLQQQSTPQSQAAMRISPESMPPAAQQIPFPPSGMSEAQMAQVRERARQMQIRQNQQAMVPKEVQRMPPPSLPNGMPNPMVAQGPGPSNPGANTNAQMTQAILTTFGQAGLQNYHSLQQGASHPFVHYMTNNVTGFLGLPIQQQLQRMQMVQSGIQQARAQQVQRAAAAAAVVGMNGVNPQAIGDAQSPFRRHSGSPPNVSTPHLHQGQQQMQQISPTHQSTNLPYAASNGMGLSMQPNMQGQRAGPSAQQGMSAGPAGMSGMPQGMNMNNLTPQQRQLILMQQQMHQRGNDGVMNPQQAYAAAQAQEKMRQEQQSRMSNHHQQQQQQQQHHSPPHNAGSPPNQGTLTNHGGMGVAGMPGIARSARSPTDAAPVTPRMPQKRPGQQNDPYHMALYNQAQRQASMGMRPGTAMGGMNPQQQQQQQAAQYGANGGTVNPGMMYSGGAGMNAHSNPQQNWQTPTPQQQQQQQFHSVSPAALQHHPDAGTPRPGSSASNNAVAPGDTMGGDTLDSLFNWNGS